MKYLSMHSLNALYLIKKIYVRIVFTWKHIRKINRDFFYFLSLLDVANKFVKKIMAQVWIVLYIHLDYRAYFL